MINQVQRYILRSLAMTTAYTVVALTITIWLSQSLRLIELVVEAGAPLRLFVWLLLLTVPTFLGIVLPIALVAAILFTYNRLTMDSELVVMRAVGIGPMGLALPALVLASALTVVVFVLNVYITPAAHRELVRLEYAIRDDHSALFLREGVFNEIGPKLSVYVRERGAGGELNHIVIHDARDPAKPVTVIGEKAVMAYDPAGTHFLVYNGDRQEFERETGRLSQLYFEHYDIDIQLKDEGAGPRAPDARERSTFELLNPSPETLATGKTFQQLIAEFHHRLSSPLLTLAFAAMGLACLLSGEFNRRGQSLRVTFAAILVVIVQSASLGLTSLATKTSEFLPALYILPLLALVPSLWILVFPAAGRTSPPLAGTAE